MIWVDVLPALKILDRWTLWTTTVTVSNDTSTSTLPIAKMAGSQSSENGSVESSQPAESLVTVTVADVCFAIFIAALTIVCARNVPGLMEIAILQRLPLDNSLRYAITSVSRYVIVLIGVILGFNAIAIGWSKVQWLATALTFGLAFGLQEIFANFVAGIILLFEQPIRVGDIVTVDDISGVVSRIRMRATTIINWDHKEYVIPNKEFITGRMLNWTLSDRTHRLVINVGIAYGSDVQLAKKTIQEICQNHPIVLKDPPPAVTFEQFGDNSLNFVIRLFIPNLDNRHQVLDEINSSIDSEFRSKKIEISFPQRDLHLRSVDDAILENINKHKKES